MHCNHDQPTVIFNTKMSSSFYNMGNNRSEQLNGKNWVTAGHSTCWLGDILRISAMYWGVFHKDSGNSEFYWGIRKKRHWGNCKCFQVTSPEDKKQLWEESQRIFCKTCLLKIKSVWLLFVHSEKGSGRMGGCEAAAVEMQMCSSWREQGAGRALHGYPQLCQGHKWSKQGIMSAPGRY